MSGPSPAAKRFVPTQTNKEGTGNDVMAELQALLKGRRASTDRVLGSPKAQRKAAAGKSNSVSEKRMNSAEKVSSDLREPERASSQGPNSNTKWHIPPPSSAAPTKKPIHPPLKASPIPIPGTSTSLIPDPGLYSNDVAESPPSQSRAAAFTSSVGAIVSMSVTNNNQSPSTNSSGGRAALTQSLPKSNLNRIGPPPNAPPPRLIQQGNSVSTATTSATAGAGSPVISLPGQMSSSGARKVSGGSPFPPKMTQKTSNITFNEPVKVTKKGAGKKAPLVTSKSSASVGIKRLLFKKKGNKKDSEPVSANLKKTKSEQKFNIRPLSPETSGSDSETANTPKPPVSCSVPMSTSTPSFAYQNVFDDDAFISRNQHKFEDAHIADKKPMPLPRKNSLSGAAITSIGFKSGGRSQEIATTALKEEEIPSNQDSGTDSPTPDRQRGQGKRDSNSQMWHIGSPSPTSSILAGILSAERRSQPGSPSSVQSPPPAASSPTGVLSPTSKGRDPRSVISPEPKKKRRSTEAFLPVTNVGGSINLLSNLSKYPLFQSDPAVSVSKNTSAMRSSPAKKQELVKTTSKGLPGSVPMRRRSTPREVRRAVMSDGAQLDLDDNDDDYIPMNPIRVTTSMNFLEVSQEETFPVDPRASGYYLKILAPDGKGPKAGAAKDEEMETMSDECPSSPDSYDEVNLGPIVTVPVRESVMSPEDEYVSISGQRPHSIVHENSKDTNVDAAGVDKDHPLLLSPSAKVHSEDLKEPGQSNQRSAQNNFQISEESGGRCLKYSDVTITPIGSEGNPVKRKPSAPKKFSYQLVQLDQEGKRSKLEDSGAKQSSQPANKHETGIQRRGSEPAVVSHTVEGERKISAPAGPVHSVQPAASRAVVASAGVRREKDTRDSLSRLADRPLPKVPEREQQQQYLQKQEESQEDTDDDMEEVDEKLYYVTTSSFAGKSDKAEPPPLSVAVPGQVPAGRVVWHEYVEIDEEEIVKMGGVMPPLPGQLLRLMPLLRSDAQGVTTTEPTWRMTTFNSDLGDDDIDACAIDRSDSLESCPYIEPPQIGSPPIVPDRPDNLDDLIKRKAVASGEYSYAAVPGQSFGVRWMQFHSSNPRHISLAPVLSKDQNQAFVLAPESEFADKDGASSGGNQKADGSSQPKSGKKVSEEGYYPPLLPPKTASLLREQRKIPAADRPQSYLIPVLTKKKKKQGGAQTNIDKGKSKSTSQLSPSGVSRDAATGERMESHKGEVAKKKRVPPLKPKPYKESKAAKHQQMEGDPEGLKVMVVDEDYGIHNPGKADSGRNKSSKSKDLKGAHRTRSSTTRMDLSPSDAIGGRMMREKSPSLGNLLETSTSSDFDSREKWIDHDKENPTIKPAKTSQNSSKVEKNATSSGPQSTLEKLEEESGGYLRKQSVTHRPLRSDAVKRRPKHSRDSPGVESDTQDQAKDASLAVIRRNRETIVKHLSRVLDMENLDLDFEQSGAAPVSDKKAPGSGGKGSQSESSRGLGEILSELDSLLKNNVCSTEDLLQAIQSRLNIKVNIQGESTESESRSDRNKPQSKQEEVTQHTRGDQDVEDSPALSQETHDTGKQTSHEIKAKEEGRTEGDINSPESENTNKNATRDEGTAPFYVNDEVLLNWKGLKMVTYTPDYMNAKYIPGDLSDASAPNSQSSDQSSSFNDPTSYEDVQKWIDATNKTESPKSDSNTKTQVKSKSPTAKKSPKLSTRTDTCDTPTPQEGASSMKEKSKRKIPLQPPIRMRSQSSIDVSPKLRRKKLTNPPPEVSELDSPTHGYQLALRMEDERMFSTVPHRRTYTVTAKDSGSTRSRSSNSSPGHTTSSSPRLSSSTGQSSNSAGQQRPNSGHRLSSDPAPGSVSTHSYSASNDAAPTLTPVSPQPSQDHLSVAMSSQQRSPSVVSLITHPHADLEQARASQKLRHHYQNLFSSEDDDSPPVGLLESTNIRDSRSFSAGSRPLQRVNTERRSTSVDPSVLATAAVAGGGNVFTNGVGVFTHKGGVLMNAGSGVVIEVPEDAIPRGKKQKLWFEVKQDVINPLQDEGHDSSHSLTDSFQFSRGSAEFENYLAGKRERKVQLSPMILIGPSDAVFSRPIKIKMPHCLPYRNNSWHLHMFAKAQTSETGDWTELSNTIGLVDLPPRRVRSKLYEKSSYQMHIDYTQVRTKQLGYFKLTGSPIRNGSHSAKRMVASVFTKKQSAADKMLQLKVFINNAIQDQIQALDKTLSEKGYGCLERNIPILCFGDGKDMELTLCSDRNSQMPLGTRSIPFGLFWRQTTVGQSHVSFEVDSIQLSNEGGQALTLRVQQAGSKLIHETNFLLP